MVVNQLGINERVFYNLNDFGVCRYNPNENIRQKKSLKNKTLLGVQNIEKGCFLMYLSNKKDTNVVIFL